MTMATTVLVCVEGQTDKIVQSVKTHLSSDHSETKSSILTLPKDQVFGKPKSRDDALKAIEDNCKAVDDVLLIFIFLGKDECGDVVDKFWGQKKISTSLAAISRCGKSVTFVDCGIGEDELAYWKETYDEKSGIIILDKEKESELGEAIQQKILEDVNNKPRGARNIPKADRQRVVSDGDISTDIFGTPPADAEWLKGRLPHHETDVSVNTSSQRDDGKSHSDSPSPHKERRPSFDVGPDECLPETAAGYVCMVGYQQFESDDLKARLTSGKDLSRMKGCFEKLGFAVTFERQLTSDETMKYFKSCVENYENLKNAPEIIICVISSHGEENIDRKIHGPATKEHHIFCKDGQAVKTADIIRLFQTSKLKGITKIFLLQACSSVSELDYSPKEDPGTEVLVQNDPKTKEKTEDSTTKDSFINQNKGGSTADAKGRRMERIVPVPKIADTPISSPVVDVPKISIKQPSVELPNPPSGHISQTDPPYNQPSESSIITANESQRSEAEEKYRSLINTTCSVMEEASVSNTKEDRIPEDVVYAPELCLNDMIIVFASATGKFAYSHESQGGWLFWALEETLTEKIKNQATTIDLLDVLREVTLKFSLRNLERNGQVFKCVCCIHHRLRKDIMIKVPPQESK